MREETVGIPLFVRIETNTHTHAATHRVKNYVDDGGGVRCWAERRKRFDLKRDGKPANEREERQSERTHTDADNCFDVAWTLFGSMCVTSRWSHEWSDLRSYLLNAWSRMSSSAVTNSLLLLLLAVRRRLMVAMSFRFSSYFDHFIMCWHMCVALVSAYGDACYAVHYHR